MVKCKYHGLHYDPEMSTGCTRCLRQAAKAQPERAPQLVVILLCILGMAFTLYYIFGPRENERTAVIDLGVASRQPNATQRIDPEPHRERVVSLETALFRIPLEETEDLLTVSAGISSATSDLSQSILALEPTIGLTAADLIARLGQALPTDQVMVSDVQKARSQWLKLRKQLLLPADWFYQPSSGRSAESSPTTAADYSEIASSLGTLVADASAEAQALSDASASATDLAADGRPVPSWTSFTRDWKQQLDRLESRLPTRPGTRASGTLLAAIQDLEQALSLARSLASETGPPEVSDTRFDEAINAALRAQQGFDDQAQ